MPYLCAIIKGEECYTLCELPSPHRGRSWENTAPYNSNPVLFKTEEEAYQKASERAEMWRERSFKKIIPTALSLE